MKIRNLLSKMVLFVIGGLSFFNCQTEANPPILPTQKVVKPQKVANVIQKTPPELVYKWHSNFDVKTSIVNQIAAPPGFYRVNVKDNSFQQWLRYLPLYPSGQKVRTFDGSLKWNQQVHHRVIDIDIGKRDLQQCADAVMRLRSEYLFGKKEFAKIHFNYTNGTTVSYDDWRKGRKPIVKGNKVSFSNTGKNDDTYNSFKKYLIQIFSYAGTASLEKEMKSIGMNDMRIGDVLIQGGHPGHAVIVVDMIENSNGKKLYLLAQSYMPAQNIHILKNPIDKKLSPWFELKADQQIHTPEWDFFSTNLKRFVD